MVSASSSLTPDTIQSGLVGLAELYISVEELINSPLTQNALLHNRDGLVVEEALEGSIGLLDSCSTLTDLLSLMKENVQKLQSGLRRKAGDFSIECHVSTYFCSQKQAKKLITKGFRVLNKLENKITAPLLLDVNQHLSIVVRVLREVSGITINVFRSLLLSTSSSKSKPIGRWSMITNLMMKSSTSCERDKGIVNEVESVELALRSLRSNVDVQMANKRFQKLDARIECFKAGLDSLFRRLILSRASLLNILAK